MGRSGQNGQKKTASDIRALMRSRQHRPALARTVPLPAGPEPFVLYLPTDTHETQSVALFLAEMPAIEISIKRSSFAGYHQFEWTLDDGEVAHCTYRTWNEAMIEAEVLLRETLLGGMITWIGAGIRRSKPVQGQIAPADRLDGHLIRRASGGVDVCIGNDKPLRLGSLPPEAVARISTAETNGFIWQTRIDRQEGSLRVTLTPSAASA